jgi:hypothetical protein
MWCDLTKRRALRLAALALAGVGSAALAEPPHPNAGRRSFDFSRPKPGEMQPNPTTGVGSPPTLAQFRPTAEMGPATAAAPVATGDNAPAPASLASSAAPAVAIAPAQAHLGSAVAHLGIDGVLKQNGSPIPLAMLQSLRESLAVLPPDLSSAEAADAGPHTAGAKVAP